MQVLSALAVLGENLQVSATIEHSFLVWMRRYNLRNMIISVANDLFYTLMEISERRSVIDFRLSLKFLNFLFVHWLFLYVDFAS